MSTARTVAPRARSCRTTSRPRNPAAPVTRITIRSAHTCPSPRTSRRHRLAAHSGGPGRPSLRSRARFRNPRARSRSRLGLRPGPGGGLGLRPGLGGGLFPPIGPRARALLRPDPLRQPRPPGLAIPFLVRFGRDLTFHQELRELPALGLALERHRSSPPSHDSHAGDRSGFSHRRPIAIGPSERTSAARVEPRRSNGVVYDPNPVLDDPTPKRPLQALTDWLRRTPRPKAGAPSSGGPARIGHYVITGTLGQGGMGIVYAAQDERLGRAVALKTMTSLSGDETARRRFWREARAAASVNHPNICQLYEIGEESGELYIAMELLEGEALAERLKRGSLNVAEALPVGLGILSALAALHARGVIHRDLKPSNVFLTRHGVKLLDFGLARASDPEIARHMGSIADLTSPGMMMGTPRYMAPEQITGEPMDARSDLFAAGAVLFEALSGRPAFGGRSVVEILHATLHEQPPALTGSPAVAAVDRVIRRAMSKRPADRQESADAMADELRAVRVAFGDETPAMARALTRLVVLPFRVLRPDPETDFLAFSLPDAIASSWRRTSTWIGS
ncbi:MAG: serine/threonine protein kinase [Candidatus Eisenbacteria bacterium]|uniref:Serine/threonine protein kinase n=1 Tax=Eiseniibacteriota bacterium TaxID=2212470 RepID=A0A538U8Q5_UNCEI|nr:MAG: serine/threonine protein kinase [Candidatus Eisenbacteria bacterium]